MNSAHHTRGRARRTVEITRVAERHWHALEDDTVVGRGGTTLRPDGRTFLSIDAWHAPVFVLLSRAMLADLPRPLFTVVDEADTELTAQWLEAGFTIGRREWEYVVPTDPLVTGLDDVSPPEETTIVPLGEARYAVAAPTGEYLGLLRLAPLPRQPRIVLLVVRADVRRRGIARAMLAHVLGVLHEAGHREAAADVHEGNRPAIGLVESLGARAASSNLELVLR
jgi:ribosomal protein S18 acetylase RimI-like enzyme